MRIGNREFEIGKHTYIMGILNVTPDSFSDGGKYNKTDVALYRVEEMLNEGCDIIDVGGESTRPGYTLIPDEEEIERVLPIIENIKSRFDVPISLDTYKAKVAQAGITAGADMINDIWGFLYDEKMAEVVAKADVSYTLMHNRKNPDYGDKDFITCVIEDLQKSLAIGEAAGVKRERIILDPGVGFAKSYEQNLECIAKLDAFSSFQLPILLGTSRKSVIGLTLDLPANERVEGTLATTAFAVQKGASFVRVHDIAANKRLITMMEAIKAYV